MVALSILLLLHLIYKFLPYFFRFSCICCESIIPRFQQCDEVCFWYKFYYLIAVYVDMLKFLGGKNKFSYKICLVYIFLV